MAMTVMEFFWIFLMLSALQPVMRRKVLDWNRLRALTKLEKRRGSRVIALVHRQETMAFLGFPLVRYIDVHDSEDVLRAIKLTGPDVPIDLIIHTPGGLVLAADEIVMDPNAVLGPVIRSSDSRRRRRSSPCPSRRRRRTSTIRR